MRITLAGALLVAMVCSLHLNAVKAVCCTGEWQAYETKSFIPRNLLKFERIYCDDGAPIFTKGDFDMAVCSVGPCNFFGCNCDNGCRTWRGFTIKDQNSDLSYEIRCKGDMMARSDYTIDELVGMKDACGCFGPYDERPIALSELEPVQGPEEVVSEKLHCYPGHGACVLEIEHIRSFTVTTGFEMSAALDFSKVVPASLTLTTKTDWAHETGTSMKYQCQVKEGYRTWISIRPKLYKLKILVHSEWYTRGNGENPELRNIPVCKISYVYLPRTNSQNSIAGDMFCNAEKI